MRREKKHIPLLGYLGLSLLIILSACNSEDSAPAREATEDIFVTNPPQPGRVIEGQCYTDTHATPNEVITRKLDIIIIPDTSGSIINERAAIANGFDAFIDVLPDVVDYNIGVILGHGSTSSRTGKIYQRGAEPKVLKSTELDIADIKTHLRTKMMSPHTDNASDGGEEGMYSLLEALKADNLLDHQLDGLFREDAALAVIFVADEQDICAEFPEGVVPVVDPQGKETSSYNNDCIDGLGARIITPQRVIDELRALKGDMPMVVGGVLYNNLATIPLEGENELGYGYLKAIELAGGLSVDMANGDYRDGLTNLGTLASVSIQPVNDFLLGTTRVDLPSLSVTLDNQNIPYTYNSELNMVSISSPRDPFSVVQVSYCEKDQVIAQAKEVITGGFHSCALLTNGDVKCWGQNNFGQLGLGHTNIIGDDEDIASQPVLSLGEAATQLSAGLNHTCALLASKNVKCWGLNNHGQLGLANLDTIGDDELPSSVANINLGGGAKKIFSGTFHNCAIMESGYVRCWGANFKGQLGLGHTDSIGDDEHPAVAGNIGLGSKVTQMDLSTISQHNCAILTNGTVKCWGDNSSGQLGLGHTDDIGDDELPSSTAALSLGANALQLATGNSHTCALLTGGDVRCWGGNNFGQLGLGNAQIIGDDELPNSVAAISLNGNVTQISAGNFNSCVLFANHTVQCFGQGSTGQLGQGSVDNLGDDEVPSDYGAIDLGVEVTQISSGINHTCALVKESGQAKCWGQGSFGQLGLGNTFNLGDDELPSSAGVTELIP